MMRWFAVCPVAALLGLIVACGGRSDEGGFIDTHPIRGSEEAAVTTVPFSIAAQEAKAVAVVAIRDVVDIATPTEYLNLEGVEGTEDVKPPVIPVRLMPRTTYRAAVELWIKGGDASEITMTWLGGIADAGPRFYDGTFLPDVGRKYVVVMEVTPPDAPGSGQYQVSGAGWANFEVTDGYVHVLNHPLTHALQQQYGGMKLEEFVALIEGYVASSPPPSPTPGTQPLTGDGGSAPVANPVQTLGVDTDIDDGGGNTANAAPGLVTPCRSVNVGDRFYIDVFVIDAADLSSSQIGPDPGVTFDPAVITIDDDTPDPLSFPLPRLNGSVADAGGARPSTTGDYFAAYFDFGAADTGSGPLWRIPVVAVGEGVSPINLSDAAAAGTIVLGDAQGDNIFSSSQTQVEDGLIAVGSPCPG